MLSQKVLGYLSNEGHAAPDESLKEQYVTVLLGLNIDLGSEIAEFNLSTIGPTIEGRAFDIYNICWFSIYSSYNEDVDWAHQSLGLPTEYIPLDSFEAEGGFFYNRDTGEVLELEAGEKLINFQKGLLQPQWTSFNEFLEWYFEL